MQVSGAPAICRLGIVSAVFVLGLTFATSGFAQNSGSPESLAIMPLETVGASPAQVSAATDQLHDLMARTGKYTVIDTARVEAALASQAYRQIPCAGSACARQLGSVMHASKVVQGKLTKLDETHWVISASLVDANKPEFLSTQSELFEGSYFDLLRTALPKLANGLAGMANSPPGISLAVPSGSYVPPTADDDSLRVPPVLTSQRTRDIFEKYRAGLDAKAFAVSADGATGYAMNGSIPAQVQNRAITNCERFTKLHCRLVAIDDSMVVPPPTLPTEPREDANTSINGEYRPAASKTLAAEENSQPHYAKPGFGIATGLGSVSGSGTSDSFSFDYSGNGLALELSYQTRISNSDTLVPFVNTLLKGPSTSFGVDIRHWFGPGFGGVRFGFEQETLTATDSFGNSATLTPSGPLLGFVAGYQWPNGLELSGSLTAARLAGSLNGDSYTVAETRVLALLGYRF
jgi:hypothetical protein